MFEVACDLDGIKHRSNDVQITSAARAARNIYGKEFGFRSLLESLHHRRLREIAYSH
jgi:hypothetical protein